MRRTILVLAVLLAVTAPATADAHRRHHRMTFEFAVMVADQYWADRGTFVRCHPQEQALTERETKDWGYSVDMLADVPACTIEVTPWAEGWRTDPDLDQNYCWEIVHEVGHLAGLEHPGTPAFARLSPRMQATLPDTVMNPDGAPYPYGCTHPRKFLKHRAERSTLTPL